VPSPVGDLRGAQTLEPSRAPEIKRSRGPTPLTVMLVAVIALIFAAKIINYVDPPLLRPAGLQAAYRHIDSKVHEVIRNTAFLHHCHGAESKISVPGGWQCASATPMRTVYSRIFRTYPAEPHGRDYVYQSTTSGSTSAGKALFAGVVAVPRYRPVRIGPEPTWKEDPYHSGYWRFNYYALRPTEDLLQAYLDSGDSRYARALVRLDQSFFRAEPSSPFAWADYHAVAFRAMVLAHQWWVLREYHELSESESGQFLRELEKTAEFLLDRNHYQPQYNHGVNESAALLELGLDFPALPRSGQWRSVAAERIRHSLADLIDRDGALVENSPYYHFYTLDKYWQLLKFTERLDFTVDPQFRSRLLQMANFSTYILHPDSSVPLLGSSIEAAINDHGSFAELGRADSSFRYVLTHGAKGRVPAKTSVFFPHAGLTVMRSGWGRGRSFEAQSHLTFNVGAFRTAHSQLDGLGITLFGAGRSLLPSPGLYEYAGLHPSAMFNYFHGTGSHNTVTVDNRDQIEGAVSPGPLRTQQGVTYQSAESSLYPGVTHRRMVMMLDASRFLIIDRLSSQATHSYRQMFHFFPGAQVLLHGSTAIGSGADSSQQLTIRQLGSVSDTELQHANRRPPRALCSQRYQHARECVAVVYLQRGKTAAYTTLLTIGRPQSQFRAWLDQDLETIHVIEGDRRLIIGLRTTPSIAADARASDTTIRPTTGTRSLPGAADSANWVVSGNGSSLADAGAQTVASVRALGSPAAILDNSNVHADLDRSNLQIRLRISVAERLSALDLDLSNRHWSSFITNDLRNAYPPRYDGEWLTISLGRGRLRDDSGGRWVAKGGPFDWAKIDGVRLRIESGSKQPVSVELSSVKAIPQQRVGVAAIIFDDGYDSILPAAAYLHRNKMPANVAVIGKYTAFSRIHHLTKYDLLRLQNRWGWNMANHTQNHVDAVASYASNHDLAGYARDILQGARILQQNGLDSAPDWFIYPHGAVNAQLETVVRRFYRFARTTDKEPEAYPFGDPLRVKTLEVASATDSEGGSRTGMTDPAQVGRAAQDAVRFHTTLIVTVHRIHTRSTDPPGYPLGAFQKIVDELRRSHIRVVTLSGLDRLMGLSGNDRIVMTPGRPAQIAVALKETQRPHKGLLASWMDNPLTH
jgi:hypothetical protein